jgi:polar amino acid transport system substrate-binding protein
MQKRKFIAVLAVLGMIAAIFTGCTANSDLNSTQSTASTASEANSDKVKISDIEDVTGITIAVQQGTIGNDLAEEIKTKDPKTTVTSFEKYIDAITALKQTKADAIIMDNAPAEFFVKENADLMILAKELTTEEYALAIKKGNDDLLKSVNEALAAMKADGTLAAIILKYQKDASMVTTVDLNKGATGGKLTMGTETGFAPYEYKEGSVILGIDVEIAAYIAKKMNKELVITDMAFDSLIPSLTSSKIDIIAAGMTVTEERKKNINFSDPYIDAKQVVVIRKSSFN